MKYLTGAVIAYATVLIWRRWWRPYLVWQFSRGDYPRKTSSAKLDWTPFLARKPPPDRD